MRTVWNLSGTCLELLNNHNKPVWNLSGTCHLNPSGTRPEPVWNPCGTCLEPGWNLSKLQQTRLEPVWRPVRYRYCPEPVWNPPRTHQNLATCLEVVWNPQCSQVDRSEGSRCVTGLPLRSHLRLFHPRTRVASPASCRCTPISAWHAFKSACSTQLDQT
jgi:hypothetical protein